MLAIVNNAAMNIGVCVSFFLNNFIYLVIFCYTGSSFLCAGFL